MFNEKTIVYILITVVILGGTVFGMSMSEKLNQKQMQVEIQKFLIDMDSNIDKTRDNYGKVVIHKFKLPKNVIDVCLVDFKSASTNMTAISKYPTILESVNSNIQKNMFIVIKEKTLKIDPYFNIFVRLNNRKAECFQPTDRELEFKFSGVGNATMIELVK
jgi:hypothetical protein